MYEDPIDVIYSLKDKPKDEISSTASFLVSVESNSMPEQSSLDLPESVSDSENNKYTLFKQGLYDPGSGEICTKYLPLSDSSILRHAYYHYPSIEDPGIEKALLEPIPKAECEDNAMYYLKICDELGTTPVRIIKNNLDKMEIDLRYYGVSSSGIQAMCLTLNCNKTVKRIDLSSNYLDLHACFHVGLLIEENNNIREIILEHCKLQADGFQRIIANVWRHSTFGVLNVSSNEIGDRGFQFLIDQFDNGAVIRKLHVSYNQLTDLSALRFSEVLRFGSLVCTFLDISWNSLGTHRSNAGKLLQQIALSTDLVEVNLSNNYLDGTQVLQYLISSRSLVHLNLSNNRFRTPTVPFIVEGIKRARSLKTLKLSGNMFSPDEALLILKALDSKTSVACLELEHIDVEPGFLQEMAKIKVLRSEVQVKYGRVVNDYIIQEARMEEIVLRRLNYLSDKQKKYKKLKFNFCVYMLTYHQSGKKYIDPKSIMRHLQNVGAKNIGEDLIDELADVFPGNNKRNININVADVCEYIKRLYPEKEADSENPLMSEKSFAIFKELSSKGNVKKAKEDKLPGKMNRKINTKLKKKN